MFDEVLLRTYEGNVEELELELSTLQYYKGFDGEIVEKYVTCKRANCICHRVPCPSMVLRNLESGQIDIPLLARFGFSS